MRGEISEKEWENAKGRGYNSIIDYKENLNIFLQQYDYKPLLTKHLDDLDDVKFNQTLINEIVLWKLNRYVAVNQNVLDYLDKLNNLTEGQHRKGRQVLKYLIETHGVDLPMASTILRFRNPNVFQIIDRHAYRAVYGKDYPLHSTSSIHRKIEIYFDYIDRLIELCSRRNLEFKTIDRLLYVFDKQINGKLGRAR